MHVIKARTLSPRTALESLTFRHSYGPLQISVKGPGRFDPDSVGGKGVVSVENKKSYMTLLFTNPDYQKLRSLKEIRKPTKHIKS